MKHTVPGRILALDLRTRSFGYAVVESPDTLLDWGVRSHRRGGNSIDVLIRKKLKPLLKWWQPSMVVVQHYKGTLTGQDPLKDRLFRGLVKEANNHRVRVRTEPKRPGTLTKYEKARLVAERIPVLTRTLPPRRKPWESENYRMPMFTAAALAMTFGAAERHTPAR